MDMIKQTNLSPRTWQVGWSFSFCPALSAGPYPLWIIQSRKHHDFPSSLLIFDAYIFLPDPDQKNKNRDDKTVDEKHHRRIFSYIFFFFDELYP